MSRISADPVDKILQVHLRNGTGPGNGQDHHIFATFSHDYDQEVLIDHISQPQDISNNLSNNLNNLSDIQNVQNTTAMNMTNIVQ